MVKRKLFSKLPIFIVLGIGLIICIFILIFPDITAADASLDSPPEDVNKRKSMFSFFKTVIIIGGCIALTLSYVSWRKFKGEKNKRKKKM